jgi:hypothetical protein
LSRRPQPHAAQPTALLIEPQCKEFTIARQQNTFAKRQREVAKKAKAEAKRVRRNERKHAPEVQAPPESHDLDRPPSDDVE